MTQPATVPQDPEQFFRSYVPALFEPLRGRFGGSDSPGAIVFHVGVRPPLALRITGGSLVSEVGVPPDTIVRATLTEPDFVPILVHGAELLAEQGADPDRQLAVLKALMLDRERVDLIRGVRGSVAFVLLAPPSEHRVILTPGTEAPNVEATECTVRCALTDFLAMQRGNANPFELMMNGKIQISGDAQIPMALSSLLM